MKKHSWVRLLFFCFFTLQLIDCQSQTIEKKYTFEWRTPQSYTFENGYSEQFLYFERAVFGNDFPELPSFYEAIPVDKFFSEYEVRVLASEFEEMNAEECQLVPSGFRQKSIDYQVVSAYDRKDIFALLTFVPIVMTTEGHYQRLLSVTLEITGKKVAESKGVRSHASQSVLASGQWYCFSLAETGVYKVTGQELAAMGMSIPVASSQLALFGNSGRMLPESNTKERIDDLREIPIQVSDGGDGFFDNGDYFLFYGESPHDFSYDMVEQRFTHKYNIYSEASIYFITPTPGVGEKKRVQTVDNENLVENITVNDFRFFDFIEVDAVNLFESGKTWFGDRFDATLTRSYAFRLPGTPTGAGRITVCGASSATTSSFFQVSVNQSNIGNIVIGRTMGSVVCIGTESLALNTTSKDLNVALTYNKPTVSSTGYLDWIEVEIPCTLTIRDGQTCFRNLSTMGSGNVAKFNISGVSASASLWDVTDPAQTVRIALTADGQGAHFKSSTDVLREFVVFDGTHYKSVTPLSSVANQNLHATGAVDMVIVTHPDFMAQANRLAKFRTENDGLAVKVVTTQQIYNEFSSGSQDPMAIRDYMKMIYDKTGKEYPKYLLLFGRPSYDFRGREQGTSIFVPNYQYNTVYMEQQTHTYHLSDIRQCSNDDVFGLLDEGEGEDGYGLFDLAVGRFPCITNAQAVTAVDKSIRYTEKQNLVDENSAQISNFGEWRNMMAFVADDEESNDFVIHADKFARIVDTANPNINFDKIYLDAYQQVSNAGGQRYPAAAADINNRMNRGALVYMYIGHSGKDGWAAERVFENADVNNWTNKYNLTTLLSLSCTFVFYDRVTLSPADLIFFHPNGGAFSVIAATREAWSLPNNYYGEYFYSLMFSKDNDGHYCSVSDIERKAKNRYFPRKNLEMFVYIGDPSIKLAVPIYNIVTDSINHHAAGASADTLRALSRVTVSGHLTDNNLQPVSNFNGTVFPLVYDKKVRTQTLLNDPNPNVDPFEFDIQKSVLFKGNVSVRDGRFQFSFYVPKDIDYSYGNGKISYYARSESKDAAGVFTDFTIGGMDTTGIDDHESPVIELFMNDENFVNGGITDQNPVLIAKISDNFGVNTTGNGIGHDLTGVLDRATGSKIVLNDYYQTEKDSFNCGVVRYRLQNLTPGEHTIAVRAWDVNNNSAEQELTFKVMSEDKFELSHVLNYPNPFTTHTDFFFEHNQPGGNFEIQVQIYTISGKLVKTLYDTQYMEGNRCRAISWDGLDDYGDKLAKGTYLYRLRVKNQDGQTAEMIEKLVIL